MTELELKIDGNAPGTDAVTKPGFRLQRLEVCNWGTFDSVSEGRRGNIYTVEPNGDTTLLIGHNGSGKSTLVDAILTLLVRPQVRNYNVAAGAKKQERDLKTYIKGAFDKQSHDESGAVEKFHRPDGKHCSILLAVFRNEVTNRAFTVAQVLYLASDGTADKVYCFAPEAHSIAADCSGLRNMDRLPQQMKDRGFLCATKNYSEFYERFRKATNVQPKAMDLLNQTVAVKDIQRLNDFIRQHMLESKPWGEKVERLLGHFHQLNEAWQALLRVRRQFDLLQPIAERGSEFTRLSERLQRARQVLEASESFFCQKRIELFQPECERLSHQLSELVAKEQALAGEIRDILEECRSLTNDIEHAGGQRLHDLPKLIKIEQARAAQKHVEHGRLQRLLEKAGINEQIADEESFARVRLQLPELSSTVAKAISDRQSKRDERNLAQAVLRDSLRKDEFELAALKQRQGNLPEWISEVRRRLCDDLRLPMRELPFAAELIAVRPEERAWEASIELELRSFALSLLVPDRHYRAVSGYVERTRLQDASARGQRLVYLKIGERTDTDNAPVPHPQSLVRKLELKEGHPLIPWVRGELENRFDYRCCDTIEEFRLFSGRAMTRERHVKAGSVRHSKDDREKAVDPRNFVLGWDNHEKKRRLAESIDSAQRQLESLNAVIKLLDDDLDQLRDQRTAIAEATTFTDYATVDFSSHEVAITSLELELKLLEENNDTIQHLKRRRAERQQAHDALLLQQRDVLKEQGDLERQIKSGRLLITNAERILKARDADGSLASQTKVFPTIECYFDKTPLNVAEFDNQQKAFESDRRDEEKRVSEELAPITAALQKSMNHFLRDFPEESHNLEPEVGYLGSFLTKLKQIEEEGLPEHTERFRNLLNDKLTREIQLLNTELDQERDAITDRIDLLNESLARIPWKPGTHMRLEAQLVRDREINEFRQALLECLAGSFKGSAEADEARFVQIEKLIGRLREEGRWRDKVTDVRNWFDFAAREVDDVTGAGGSFYQDSAGQSGGEKAKLAFTILVAALAYQYDLDPSHPNRDRFHFVVVDEMFSKIDDQNSQYALDLFRQFGLQLLIVSPLDPKARVTEPYVGCYLLATKDSGNFSQVHQMTAREFRDQVAISRSPESASRHPSKLPR